VPTVAATLRALLLSGLFVVASWLPAPVVAQRSLEIQRFDVTLSVEKSGWLDVREEIQVHFTGSWNGIFRLIPVEYRTPQGFSYRLFLDDVAVTGPDGVSYEFESSRERHYKKLRIRVPDAEDATRTVFIRYRVPNALKFWEEYDELYWNVTGDEWEIPIQAASAVVVLPEGAQNTRTASWTGGYGSTENAATVEQTVDGLFFESQRPLSYREGLTIAVAWDPGVVHRPGPSARAILFLRANWLLVVPFLSLAVMWRLWARSGRDPTRLSVAPQYEPPEGLTPAEAGTLLDNRPDMRDVTAGLIDLAVRGYLRIEETEGVGLLARITDQTDYLLVPIEPRAAWSDLRDHEREILSGVFGPSSGEQPLPVLLSSLEREFYTHLPEIRSGVFRELLRRGYYSSRPDRTLQKWMGAAAAVLALGVWGALALAGALELSRLTAILAGVGSALPVFGFGLFMPARTVKGARTREQVMGFEEFLERVESDRYRRMVTSPQMFERFLPYAMAFGVERKWAAAFDGIYEEPPGWFVGRWDRGFRPSHFADTVGRMSSAASSTLASRPRSSGGSGFGGGGGFSGGGGSSGGGFGGGGGGGW
jgi:uncharacterized membrane protein YgcG